MCAPGKSRKPTRRAVALSFATLVLALGLGASWGLVRIVQKIGVRTQLQAEADRAALLAAERLIGAAKADWKPPRTVDELTLGEWEASHRRFVPAGSCPNAVRVVVRGADSPYGALRRISGGLLPEPSDIRTFAVAAIRPRDIVFVIDLSSAMSAESLASVAPSAGAADASLPPRSEEAGLRELYEDLGFESFPGPTEPFGAPWDVLPGPNVLSVLAAADGPLSFDAVDSRYRIAPDDPASVRRRKAYSAVIDCQIARLMPRAIPTPDSRNNLDYWSDYLDELIGGGASDESGIGIGYASYVRFLLLRGRNLQVRDRHVPLSRHSPYCPWHLEDVEGFLLRFPPRTQPLHRVRRSLVEAIGTLAERNRGVEDLARRDRVALVTFDSPITGWAQVRQSLTADYPSAMRACARLQTVGLSGPAPPAEAGLRLAERTLWEATDRCRNAQRIVVLVTAAPLEAVRNAKGNQRQEALSLQMERLRERGCEIHTIEVRFAEGNLSARQIAGPEQADGRPGAQSVRVGQDMDVLLRNCLDAIVSAASVALVQ